MDVSGIPVAGPMAFDLTGVNERIREIRAYAERPEHYVTDDWEARGLPFAGEDPRRLLALRCIAARIPGQMEPWGKIIYSVATDGRLKQRVLSLSVENRPGRLPHPELMERILVLFGMAGTRYTIDPASLVDEPIVPIYVGATAPEPLNAASVRGVR